MRKNQGIPHKESDGYGARRNSGQESIFNGVACAYQNSSNVKDIVLIYDGVRPLIDCDTNAPWTEYAMLLFG